MCDSLPWVCEPCRERAFATAARALRTEPQAVLDLIARFWPLELDDVLLALLHGRPGVVVMVERIIGGMYRRTASSGGLH